jgi:hypothetical protein
MLQTARLLIFETHADSIFDSCAARLYLVDASRGSVRILLPGISLRLFPASCASGLADRFTVGQNTTEPFRAAAAPPLSVVSVIAIGGMTGVDVEHGSQPPCKEVNSRDGTKLVQLPCTARKLMIPQRIKWWPETGSNRRRRPFRAAIVEVKPRSVQSVASETSCIGIWEVSEAIQGCDKQARAALHTFVCKRLEVRGPVPGQSGPVPAPKHARMVPS